MEYSVETFRGTDLGSLARLHAHLMPRAGDKNLDYLRWKYLENPHIREPQIAVVRDGSEIVGMRGLLGGSWQWPSEGDMQVIPYVDDLIVHPEHRNRGLFVLLNRQTIEMARNSGFAALINVSGGRVTQELSLAAGWAEVRELERVYLVRSRSSHSQRSSTRRITSKVRGIARRFGYLHVGRPSGRQVDAIMRTVATENNRVTVSAEAQVDAMSDLAASAGHHTSSRSTKHLQWRLRNPDRTYRYLYWADHDLRGYVVLAWSGVDPQRTMIIDHCAGDDMVFRDLMAATSEIRTGVIELMSSTLSEDRRRIVHHLGFEDDLDHMLGPRRRFLVYPIDPECVDPRSSILSEARAWRVDLMDTMQG